MGHGARARLSRPGHGRFSSFHSSPCAVATRPAAEWEGRLRAERVVRYSQNGQYVIQVGGVFIDGRREGGVGNPAYLMNDLGSALNNVHLDGAGAVKVGPWPDRTCRIREGDELCWTYGEEYWSMWPGVRTVGRVERKRGAAAMGGVWLALWAAGGAAMVVRA